MYSNYKEICVILEMLNTYRHTLLEGIGNLLDKNYKFYSIDSEVTKENNNPYQSSIEYYQNEYDKVLSLINKIKAIILKYERTFTKENLKNILPQQVNEELNRDFREIEQTEDYSKIINEISYQLFLAEDPILTTFLCDDYCENLYEAYRNDELTTEQLIFYNTVIKYLLRNKNYIESSKNKKSK